LDWELQKKVALIPDEVWEGGPYAVAQEIAKIEAGHTIQEHNSTDVQTNKPPEQDDLLRVQYQNQKLEIRTPHLSEEEISDGIRPKIHERLKEAARELARAAGNYHPRLADRARALEKKLGVALDELDLLDVHLDLEDLRAIYETRHELTGEDTLEAEEIAVLERIGRIGPGLVRESEEVERFENRLGLENTEEVSERLKEAEDRLVESIAEASDMAGERLRAYAKSVQGAEADSKKGFVRRVLSRNTIIAAAKLCSVAVVSTAVGEAGTAGLVWLWEQSAVIRLFAAEQSASFAAWINLVMIEVREHLATVQGSLPQVRPVDAIDSGEKTDDETY
jgi:hypothetical protein